MSSLSTRPGALRETSEKPYGALGSDLPGRGGPEGARGFGESFDDLLLRPFAFKVFVSQSLQSLRLVIIRWKKHRLLRGEFLGVSKSIISNSLL